jgi:hypothetical protein
LSISNFGEKTLEEVYRSLEKIGFFRQAGGVDRHAEAEEPRPEPSSSMAEV